MEMLRRLTEQRIETVVATPHFYPHRDRPERFLTRRQRAAEQLRQAMENETGLPQILLGAEVYYFPGLSKTEILPQLAIGDTDCILIEMPAAPWTEDMYRELEEISHRHGLTPIIAHVDRYITPLRQYGIPERLAQMDVLVQANGSFFLLRRTHRLAMKLLKKNQIHLLGSDCHDITDRCPNLDLAKEAIRKSLGEDALTRIGGYEDRVLGK